MKQLFIITSVIDFPQKSLSYSNIRSLYSKEERLKQTIETIESIKKNCPGADIVLCEAGNTDYSTDLKDITTQYHYIGKDFLIAKAIKSTFKGFGEVCMMLSILNKMYYGEPGTLVFKISGRYTLNDTFDIKNWNSSKFNFKSNQETYSTRLYALPYTHINKLKIVLVAIVPFLLLGVSIEKALTYIIPKKRISNLKTLGVSGKVAVDGSIICE